MDPWAVASGFGVGGIVGLTGVGGGSLMTPLLIGVFGLAPALAIGTDLCFAGLTKAAGAVAHARQGQVDRRITLQLLAGSLPATLAMVAVMHAAGIDKAWAPALSVALGVALLLTACTLWYRRSWAALGRRMQRWLPPSLRPPATVAAGALLGVLVSLSSIGAGAIGAALILLLHPDLPAPRVVGTDIAHAVPLTLVAGIGHATLGHVDWVLLGMLLMGSLPGIWLGSRLSTAVPERLLRGLLCAALVTAGVKVLA